MGSQSITQKKFLKKWKEEERKKNGWECAHCTVHGYDKGMGEVGNNENIDPEKLEKAEKPKI